VHGKYCTNSTMNGAFCCDMKSNMPQHYIRNKGIYTAISQLAKMELLNNEAVGHR